MNHLTHNSPPDQLTSKRQWLASWGRLGEDVQAIFDRDPAARSVPEVLFLYPGLHAVVLHRIAHRLWRRRFWFLGRLVSQFSRAVTGIEIHPAATIGRRFVIDHGMGVVIGETSMIGDDVMLYQGVTLGGTSLERAKRHPTLGDGVIVGAQATVLGSVIVGAGARVGAGAVVVKNVPSGATVVGPAARTVRSVASEHRSREANQRARHGDRGDAQHHDGGLGAEDMDAGRLVPGLVSGAGI